MTTECTPALADEWGTSFDDEIRQFRDEWVSMETKYHEAVKEKRALEDRMLPLMKKARGEGWNMSLSHMLYGRNFVIAKNPCRISIPSEGRA